MKSKSIQKVLAIFLALGMLISYLPTAASAQAPVTQDEIVLESDPNAGTGEYLNLGDPLPADYQPTDGDYEFILDDGIGENAIGTDAGTVSIIALNRFTPGDQFPFLLTEISFLSNHANGSVLAPGQAIRLVVFQNTNTEGVTDPSIGAELMLEVNETVQVATGWNVYQLDEPILLEGPGDVLIGALFDHLPGTAYYPAVYDQDTITQRSWIGLWSGAAPSPITIPAPDPNWGELGAIGFPGTFTIRAKGMPAGNSELAGTVTNSATSDPLAGATITATPTSGNTLSGTTDANGKYSITLNAGTYTVTAAKLGYASKTETVTIPEGLEQPYVQDFALAPLPATILTGTVKDGGITGTEDKHGYPLYAKLSFTTMGVTEVAYTDPFTGAYSISLVRDTAYTVKVESLTTEYIPLTETFTTADATQSKNFELLVPVAACSTTGYGVSGTMADFDDKQLPAGWTNYDYAGSGQVWQFNDPGNRGNLTGGTGGFAIVDSDNYGYGGIQHAGLRTPVLNFSTASSVTLEFDSYYRAYGGQTAIVRYSIDGGTTWTDKLTLPSVTQTFHYTINLDELAGKSQAMVEFKFQTDYGWLWQIDNVNIGDPSCQIKNGGVVAGYVYDANEAGVKLLDAKVETTEASDTTTASVDAAGNGLYWFFQPTTATTEDVEFTISKSKYVTTVEVEEVEQSALNHIDFELGAGHLVADPPAVEVTMGLSEADRTETLTLENDGSAVATWSMTEKAGGFTPMKVSIPAFEGEIQQNDELVSSFAVDHSPAEVSNGKFEASNSTPIILDGGSEAFGLQLYPTKQLQHFPDITVPGTWNNLGTISTSYYAGDFLKDDYSKIYAISDTDVFVTIDTATGAITTIKTLTPPGDGISGISGADGFFYGISGNQIFTLDIAGNIQVIATTSIALGIDIAYVPDNGLLYIVDVQTDHLFSVNPDTGETIDVGGLGFDANYAQGMDYDEINKVLYWTTLTDADNGQLRAIDMVTGASALVGALPNNSEVDCLSIAAYAGLAPDRIPWLDEDILEGDIEVNKEQEIELTFSVANIAQPGTYTGELVVKDDSPYNDLVIPVTLNVTRPADFGSFKGTIYALEQCDIEPAPAKKATVIFSQNGAEKNRTQTDENGYFSYAMLNGKYDIEVKVNGYVSQMFTDIELGAGEDYIIDDVNLRLDAACLIVEPDSLYQEQFTGQITEQTVTFSNIGAKETVFELVEKDMGGPTPFSQKANEVNLILDDGSYDDAIGIGGTADFIAVNRFTPEDDQFPMTLTEVSVYFDASTVASGNTFKVVIYQNLSGNDDPATGSELLYQQEATVGSVPGWTVVTLNQPVALEGPGDVLIGAIYTFKPGLSYYPASIDRTSSQGRSWVGYWVADDSPSIPTLPPDDAWATLDEIGFAGNFMIRAKGTNDGSGGDILWLDIDVLADVIMPGESVDVTFTFDSTGLLWGDYFGKVTVKNQPDPKFDIPVQLRVNDWEWQFLPMLNNRFRIPAK